MSYDFTNVSDETLIRTWQDYIDDPELQTRHPHYWEVLKTEHTRRES